MFIDKTKQAQDYLFSLPCLPLDDNQLEILYQTRDFKAAILNAIQNAQQRIYMTTLYWQNDEAGQEILKALIEAKQSNPDLEIKIFVDWHRAQRGLIGKGEVQTNARWYVEQLRSSGVLKDNENIFFGVPVNTREVFGVLHVKGFVFDDTILYSGASINDVYLHQNDKYRYDRYQKIYHPELANCLVQFMQHYLTDAEAVHPLDVENPVKTKEIRNAVRQFRRQLASFGQYQFKPAGSFEDYDLALTPLFGLGKSGNQLNHVIQKLFYSVEQKLIICTPYFNLPRVLQKRIKYLLKQGRTVEIIVGDKTANDFYIPPSEPFKMIGALPYLYESNLRRFAKKFDAFVQTGHLIIRTWKQGENSYHLKGVWVDNHYILLTGNNLNPRAWRLDAENGLLIRDAQAQLQEKCEEELMMIRQHTNVLRHYSALEEVSDYPEEVQKVLKRFSRLKVDAAVRMML